MTKRDFFKIIIKLFGLYAATIMIFQLIPTNLSYIISTLEFENILIASISSIIYIGLAIGFFLLIIFNSDKIIDLLKLDKGFDDEIIKFEKFNSLNIMKIAIILIGGIMIIDNFPKFLSYAYYAFRSAAKVSVFDNNNTDYRDVFNWTVSGINILIGYLLMTNFKSLSNWMIKGSKEKNVG